jgi:hypothetical protein
MRLFKIISNDLSLESQKLEEELERTVNTDSEINDKVDQITRLLKELAIINLSKTIWNGYAASSTKEEVELDNDDKNE